MIILSDIQKKLAKDLLTCIAKGRYYITYGGLAAPYNINPHHELGNEIGEISKRCHELDLPLISAMVVRKEDNTPGNGFKTLCDHVHLHEDMDKDEAFIYELNLIKKCKSWYKLAEDIGADISNLGKPIIDPVSQSVQSETISEGKQIQINATAYERKPELREACIRANGTKCMICGFDAGEVYGEEFAGRIHIHHIVPLGDIKMEHTIDPIKDLIPVCPNCHMILHSKKNGVYTPDEVKEMIMKKHH